MVKVTRIATWMPGARPELELTLTPREFSELVRDDARIYMGLSHDTAHTLGLTAGYVAMRNDRFSLGAHFRYQLERVA